MNVVVALDATASAHLARALEAHRRWCQTNGHRLPSGLVELALLASAGHKRTNGDGDGPMADDGPMTPLLLTYAEAAERLRVSERTVRRLVAEGELRPVTVGTRRRIHHDDLTNYAAELRTEGAAR